MSTSMTGGHPGLVHRTKSDLAHAFIRERIYRRASARRQADARLTFRADWHVPHADPRSDAATGGGRARRLDAPREMRVAPLLRHDALELFEIRGALEGLSSFLACPRVDENFLKQLGEANADFARAHRHRAHSRMGESPTGAFTASSWRPPVAPSFPAAVESVWAKCRRFRLGYRLIPGRAAATISEHDRIIAAFAAGDAEAARASTSEHVNRASDDLLALLAADEAEARQSPAGET